jgi:glutamate synthase domain-containing protein 2
MITDALSTIADFFFLGFVGILFLGALYIALKDRTQIRHSIRRNFPIIGRGRWIMESIAHFYKAYFTGEREGEPFNDVQRVWAVKAGKKNKTTESFGSTLKYEDMTFSFVNSFYPYLPDDNKEEDHKPSPITYGAKTENPYTSNSRINISGMSYGALSDVAVLSLSYGAAKGDFLMNTGEGGLSKFHTEGGAPLIYQIGTAKYGCQGDNFTLDVNKLAKLAKNDQIKMFEIKLSQGAKPGKGGMLMGEKVTKEIAETRDIPMGKPSFSPNGHTEAFDDESLSQLIYNVKKHSKKPTGIKLCLGDKDHLDSLFEVLVEKQKLEDGHLYIPDFITLDSADGGTGAAPLTHMDAMGMFLVESLPVLISKLNEYKLRKDIKVICSGQMITPVECGWAFAKGVDAINIGRGFLFNIGCIQARKCSKNTCPSGVATHNTRYTRGLVPADKKERVYNYQQALTKELMEVAHSCGVQSFDKLHNKHIREFNKIAIKVA